MINFKSYPTGQPNSGSLGLEYYTEQEIKDLRRANYYYIVFGGFGLGMARDGTYWLIDDSRDELALYHAPLTRPETGGLYKMKLWFTDPQEAFAFTERFKGKTITWEEYHNGKVEGMIPLYSDYSYNLVKTQKP